MNLDLRTDALVVAKHLGIENLSFSDRLTWHPRGGKLTLRTVQHHSSGRIVLYTNAVSALFEPDEARAILPDLLRREYDESKHPRDDHGRWTDAGDGGGDTATTDKPGEPILRDGNMPMQSVVLRVPSVDGTIAGEGIIEVLINPTEAHVLSQMHGGEHMTQELRAVRDVNGNLYTWLASEAVHMQVVRGFAEIAPNITFDETTFDILPPPSGNKLSKYTLQLIAQGQENAKRYAEQHGKKFVPEAMLYFGLQQDDDKFTFVSLAPYGLGREYDESKHPRDENGRWTDAGGGGENIGGGGGPEFAGDNPDLGLNDEQLAEVKYNISNAYPNIPVDDIKIDGPPDYDYNCIGWAFGDSNRPWWPGCYHNPFSRGFFWPNDDANRISSFEHLLTDPDKGNGSVTEDQKPEKGFVKLALFTYPNGEPTHIARQLANGEWSSKLGMTPLIRHGHDVFNMDGGDYGNVYKIYKLPEDSWRKLKDMKYNA